MGGLLFCLMVLNAQTLPSITSATYLTSAPVGNSPKSATTVKVKVPSIEGVATVHVSVADGSNNVLHTQEYDIARVAAPAKEGGYVLSLKFFSAANLATSSVKVTLEDTNETLGTVFTATEQ